MLYRLVLFNNGLWPCKAHLAASLELPAAPQQNEPSQQAQPPLPFLKITSMHAGNNTVIRSNHEPRNTTNVLKKNGYPAGKHFRGPIKLAYIKNDLKRFTYLRNATYMMRLCLNLLNKKIPGEDESD